MTIRNILVPVANRPECTIALKTSFQLARSLGSNVTGCHIRPHPEMSVEMPKSLRESHLAQGEAKAVSAARLFEKMASEAGLPRIDKPRGGNEPSVSWVEMVGDIDHIFPIVGRTADLIIVSRPKKRGGVLARQFVTEAMLNTGRPVLVLPQRGTPGIGKNIAIAWDRGSEASRAVKLALPLLKMAETVTFLEASAETKPGPKARDMAQYLAWHGIKAGIQRLKGQDSPEILLEDAMADKGLDLLVMGAYSHNRFRQIVFGGVTSYMVNDANIPLFVVH